MTQHQQTMADDQASPLRSIADLPHRFVDLMPRLRQAASRLLGDATAAEDLVQDAFVTALQKAERFDRSRPMAPWLLGILIRHAMQARRRAARLRAVDHRDDRESPSTESVVLSRERAQMLLSEIARMPARYRDVMELFLVEDLGLGDISQRLSRSRSTVSTQLGRGLRRLGRVRGLSG